MVRVPDPDTLDQEYHRVLDEPFRSGFLYCSFGVTVYETAYSPMVSRSHGPWISFPSVTGPYRLQGCLYNPELGLELTTYCELTFPPRVSDRSNLTCSVSSFMPPCEFRDTCRQIIIKKEVRQKTPGILYWDNRKCSGRSGTLFTGNLSSCHTLRMMLI